MRCIILSRLWPVRLYDIFPHYLTNITIFGGKNDWTWTLCFDFLYNLCVIPLFFLKKYQPNDIIILRVPSLKYLLLLLLLSSYLNLHLNFLDTFSRNTIFDFHENHSGGSLIFPCGRMDVQTDRYD